LKPFSLKTKQLTVDKMDRANFNFGNQNYLPRSVNGYGYNYKNTHHRSIPPQFSTTRHHFNNYNKGTGGVNGPHNHTGFYSPNQYDPVPRYSKGFGDTFVTPSPSNPSMNASYFHQSKIYTFTYSKVYI